MRQQVALGGLVAGLAGVAAMTAEKLEQVFTGCVVRSLVPRPQSAAPE